MHVVLDIDLDFFVSPRALLPQWSERMPQGEVQDVASTSDCRRFLEQQCNLNPGRKLTGHAVRLHHEAFHVWRDWINAGKICQPFTVIHVDAHADLGLGESGYVYLLTDLLGLPVPQRNRPDEGPCGMNEANYLAFAVANRWISELIYVAAPTVTPDRDLATPNAWMPNDLPRVLFHRHDPRTGYLELKHYATKKDAVSAACGRDRDVAEVACEPRIPFRAMRASEFSFAGFSHMIVAQSPRYTPQVADSLLGVIQEYCFLK